MSYGNPDQYGGYPPQPPQPYGQPPRTAPLAIVALVVGIVAFLTGWIFVLGLLLGIAGVILSILAMRKTGSGKEGGRPLAIIGLIASGIATLTGLVVTTLALIALIAGATDDALRSIPTPSPTLSSDLNLGGDEDTFSDGTDEDVIPSLCDQLNYDLAISSPDAAAGQCGQVYLTVGQFDENTGECAIGAAWGMNAQAAWEGPSINGIFVADPCSLLEGVSEDDGSIYVADVQVIGALTYDSVEGQTVTVPEFYLSSLVPTDY